MKLHPPIVLLGLLSMGLCIAGCGPSTPKDTAQPAAQSEQLEQTWQESTLSKETIAKANAAVLDYRQCLDKETKIQAGGEGDSRAIANMILKACESRLGAIKEAFDAENVPANISERYQRKTRSQGVQMVMFRVQAVQAQKAAQQDNVH